MKQWRAVQMGSEGWAVFGPLRDLLYGHMLASNLTEEDAKLMASAPFLQQRVEALAGELAHANAHDCEPFDDGEHDENRTWWALTDEQRAYWISAAQEQGEG